MSFSDEISDQAKRFGDLYNAPTRSRLLSRTFDVARSVYAASVKPAPETHERTVDDIVNPSQTRDRKMILAGIHHKLAAPPPPEAAKVSAPSKGTIEELESRSQAGDRRKLLAAIHNTPGW